MVSSQFYLNFCVYLVVNRTGLHSSQSEPRPHFMARGFLLNMGRWTIHVDDKEECLGFWDNVGPLTNKYFNILANCDRI
jgi:hypothetical protein